MSDELDEKKQELFQLTIMQAQNLITASQAVEQGDYITAKDQIQSSMLPDDTKVKIINALDTSDPYVIQSVFYEYGNRMGNVFCETCWEEPDIHEEL
jgi:hypothetical protein